jgi:ABC-type bacteriocin/lantibiotic exporter with double-glycine peptidase domain
MNKLKTLGLLADYYLRLLRETGWRRVVVLQVLGIATCLMNLVGISALFPFFSIFVLGSDEVVRRYVAPYFGGEPPQWIRDHLPALVGAGLVAALLAKSFLQMLYAGEASNIFERYTAKMRNRINGQYLDSIGQTVRLETRSKLQYLNNQLIQFSSYSYALAELNLKIYVFLALLALLVALSLKVTLVVGAFVGIILLVGSPIYSWTRRTADDYYSTLEGLQSQLTEFLDGAEVIKSLDVGASRIAGFQETNSRLISRAFTLSLSRQAISSLPEVVIMACGVAAVLAFQPGKDQIVFLGTYFYSLNRLLATLNELSQRFNSALELQKVPRDIYDYVATLPAASDVGKDSMQQIRSITLSAIKVRDQEKVILDGVSFTIPIGRKTQIVGPNGSGKSSVARCLVRSLPYEGEILINGTELRRLDPHELHRRISYHGQHQFLFHDTVMGNLLIGNPAATPEEARRLCARLGFERFIGRLDNGYDTIVQESSANLSGGERQALCLARVLLRKSDVYILDEYANHLDEKTLASVNDYLKSLDASLLLITHDMVEFADGTIRMEHGR